MGLDVFVYKFERILDEPVEGWLDHLIDYAPVVGEGPAYYHDDEDDLMERLEGFIERRKDEGRPLSTIEIEVIRKWIRQTDGKLLNFNW